jgi:hypothetical protein
VATAAAIIEHYSALEKGKPSKASWMDLYICDRACMKGVKVERGMHDRPYGRRTCTLAGCVNEEDTRNRAVE